MPHVNPPPGWQHTQRCNLHSDWPKKVAFSIRLLIGRRLAGFRPFPAWPGGASRPCSGVPRMRSRTGRAGRLAGAMAAAAGGDSDGDSEELVLTPAQLIHSLEQVPWATATASGRGKRGLLSVGRTGADAEAWLNEKFAPELLESKPEVIECVVEQLDHMEANLKRAKRGDLRVSVHHMEIERIRYVLSSYLRCRLVKIEKFFPHILEKEKSRAEGEPSILSPEEFAFAKEYMANTEAYLKNVALKHMPPNLQKVSLLKSVPKPNLDSFVFLRVLERQENILVEPETDEQREYAINLEEGSQHLMRYRTVAPLVASGAVQLI
ncbi:DNA replication complex GINS protein SLD5 [Parus major]|uniref:DNA replication complex GINS protein SLD5 n=1 Tax=Parus major TaxID=9157 RepID=UPI0014446D79|nr:DNA replication complex GINS protein SLD5 [Parus major]XP_033375348.1 DNA replication complex GINS protein SLD5 [Parus major]XP_033375349.1 DNA replication complex GINS protein SLD5 [Parus major]